MVAFVIYVCGQDPQLMVMAAQNAMQCCITQNYNQTLPFIAVVAVDVAKATAGPDLIGQLRG